MSEQVEDTKESGGFFQGSASDQHSDDEPEQGQDQNETDTSKHSEEETVEVSKSELEELRNEREEYEQKYLRKVADLKNLRKRKEKEKEEFRKYAHTDVLSDLLDIIDNFERALDSMEIENEDVREGVEMIETQLRALLDKYDVEPIDAEGQRFDPHKHEGMMREKRDDIDEQTVVEAFKKGYELHDRVLRPASVKVAVPEKNEDAGGNDGSENDQAVSDS